MITLGELANKFGTAKREGDSNFVSWYDNHFSHVRDKAINLLDVGIADGASLSMWRQYFPNATITGIDRNPECAKVCIDGVAVHIGSQTDSKFLLSLNHPFDVIIEDGSIDSDDKIACFKTLFPLLSEGGVYVIEHLQHSYLQRNSVVKYIHELIDSMNGYGKFLSGNRDFPVHHSTDCMERSVYSIYLHTCIAFIYKRAMNYQRRYDLKKALL